MKTRYLNLSLYRLIATFLVLQFHIIFILFIKDVGMNLILSKFLQGLTAMSGFLMARKTITSVKDFYISRSKKILVPLLMVTIFILLWNILYMLITKNYDFRATFIGYRTSSHSLLIEMGNFYYVLYILGCYLITPILEKKNWLSFVFIGLVFVLECASSLITNPLFIASSYIVGYYIGRFSFEKYVSGKLDIKRVIFWLILVGSSLFWSLYVMKNYGWRENIFYKIGINLLYSTFGVSSLFFFLSVLKILNREREYTFFRITDELTYFIFLFNQAFMCGAMDVSKYVVFYEQKVALVYTFVIVFSLLLYVIYKLLYPKLEMSVLKLVSKKSIQ